MNFDDAFGELIIREGSYVNNPSDPGGETMYGVTARVARAHGYAGPMRSLSIEQAKSIARSEYWDTIKADDLPDEIRFDVFDTAYNSGVSEAVRLLQRAAGVNDDGKLGPVTLNTIRSLNPWRLLCRFNGQRLEFLRHLGTWQTFGGGWAGRVAKNLMEA
jgi:lysozyme family protein